jgi:Chemotaxis signal transduction protein
VIAGPIDSPPGGAPAAGPSKLDRFKEIAGLRRDGLVHGLEVAEESERVEVLTFAISGEHYAAGIERVVEIIPLREATRVPNADPAVRGIISLRGRIVTIMDARARLGHPSVASGPDSRIIVVERGSETLGFEVDRVLRVVKVEASEIEPQPVVHTSEEREPIRGVFRQATALTILLDLDKLLA